jgi:membrane-associated protease RseP (regulator of RpoE activity)
MADFFTLLFVFVIISAIVTFVIKKFTSQETYYVASLIRTTKPIKFFSSMARHTKFLDFISTAGLILGFGTFAIDYLYGSKLRGWKRLFLNLAGFFGLSGLMFLIDFFGGNIFSKNAMMGNAYPLFIASFGLLGFAGFTLFALLMQAIDIIIKYFAGSRACPGVAPLIPGVEVPNVPITPPLHAWISLIIILIVHEAMHGIVGSRHGFRIKSTGVILFGFLPIGAFVEPDEKELEKAEPKKLLPFLAAGPAANLALMVIVGFLVLGLVLISNPFTDYLYPGVTEKLSTGVKVIKVNDSINFCGSTYPATAKGFLLEGDIIKKIDDSEIKGIPSMLSALQRNKFEEKKFEVDRNGVVETFKITPNALGQFGFVAEPIKPKDAQLPPGFQTYVFLFSLIMEFLYWLFLLNLLVAAINFLPMNPFDGGRIAGVIFSHYAVFLSKDESERKKKLQKYLVYIIFSILLINALPLFF